MCADLGSTQRQPVTKLFFAKVLRFRSDPTFNAKRYAFDVRFDELAGA